MPVEGVNQGRAFLHNPYAGMFVPMNAAFMPLGLTKLDSDNYFSGLAIIGIPG